MEAVSVRESVLDESQYMPDFLENQRDPWPSRHDRFTWRLLRRTLLSLRRMKTL